MAKKSNVWAQLLAKRQVERPHRFPRGPIVVPPDNKSAAKDQQNMLAGGPGSPQTSLSATR
ncbi:MAG: hypothetical protein BWY68_00719 [bacterium ADurb.Bin400]|nr:MAG: hypothetical protein BWY68_00719 [bacterium ADurb.Bin400]